jgi:predicted metalloprotease with PDZ domain
LLEQRTTAGENLARIRVISMTQKAVWACTLLLAGLSIGVAQAADLTVRVDARGVARKRIHTEVTLAVKPGPLTLVYPKWMPGEHGPTGPLASMIGLEIKANGERLSWSRDPLEMYALHVAVPHGVDHLDVSIESGLATEGEGFTAAPTSSAQLAILSWNQFLLLPKGVDADRLSVSATLIAPSGWTVVCALGSKAGSDGAIEYESSTVARLIDSPVQMGLYAKLIELKGSEPRTDIKQSLSLMADSAAALAVPDDFAQGYSRLVAESGALFGSRMYRYYTWLVSLSDHIAHFGLEHHESSDDRTDENALSEVDLRMDVAELLGHEYVHSWNGKYRRPQGLLSPDYQKPMDGSLLWVYEGMTQFWGEVLPTRAGLITPEYFRETLAAVAGYFDTEPGAGWRPLADTATAGQVLFDAPGAWQSSRRSVDFYEASVLLWLDVDAELRARSQGRVTLDDYVKRFYSGASGAPQVKPYVEQDVYDTLASLVPGDWRIFIHHHLDPTGTTALFGALERCGWKLAYSAETNASVETRQKRKKRTSRQWSIGLELDKDAKIIDVIEDRAVARAGASPGMTVIAVNGKKFTAKVLDAAIAEAQTTHNPIALLVEDSDYYRTLSVEYYDGPRYPHLVRVEGRPDLLSAVFSPRVK